ncbi:hypothetical protein [Alkalinema pantanalense]|uniref:hypothetical protein n=1 Tax=Alkalinema pantanalense TaxID=1620705 RepID=UPI003D6F4C95
MFLPVLDDFSIAPDRSQYKHFGYTCHRLGCRPLHEQTRSSVQLTDSEGYTAITHTTQPVHEEILCPGH